MQYKRLVFNFIEKHALIEPEDRIVIGLSGGADSVSLLLLLCELRKALGLSKDALVCVHVNHMLRGLAADKDEEFSKELCKRLGVPFVAYHKNIAEYAKEGGYTIEEAGRNYRYACFNEVMEDYGCNKIAVAHHKNDLAETVIFNMLRGSGLRGMRGITPKRDNIIRPLLALDREQVEAFLRDRKQRYRTDESNSSMDYSRNRIRHQVLPAMLEVSGDALNNICGMAEQLWEDYAALEKQVDQFVPVVITEQEDNRCVFSMVELCKLEKGIQSELIMRGIENLTDTRKDIARVHIEAVLGLLDKESGASVDLPYKIQARKSYASLVLEKRRTVDTYRISLPEIEVGEIVEIALPNEDRLRISKKEQCREVSKKKYTKMFDYGKIDCGLCIRTPLDNDEVVINQEGNTKKLSRIFTDNKIDRGLRTNWPVIASGNHILWAVGLRYGENYRIDESTCEILQIEYLRKGETDGGEDWSFN